MSVQVILIILYEANKNSFNTSYVSVQDIVHIISCAIICGFNTSYVSVQVICLVACTACFVVSIHPMCRFKRCIPSVYGH